MTEEARRARIARYLPALMLVTDPSSLSCHPERSEASRITTVLRAAIEGGVNMIQVRDKRPNAKLLRLADTAVDALDGDRTRAIVWINDNYAVAMTVETFALHLPADRPMPPERQRSLVSVSRSVHGLEAAERAEAEGADMLVLGTVSSSQSHPGGATIGIDGVREVCERVNIPVIGIGGITAQNAGDVIRGGASGVAVISAIFDAADPRAAATELRAAIDAAWAERKVT